MFADTFLYFFAVLFEIVGFVSLYIFFKTHSKKLFWFFTVVVGMGLFLLSLFSIEENILASEKFIITCGLIFIIGLIVILWKFLDFLGGDDEKCQK